MARESQNVKKQAVKGFLKVFSCAHSMIKTISEQHQMPVDTNLLRAATGFAAGLSTMGDICGMVNGGVLILGKNLGQPSPDWERNLALIITCNQFYQMTKVSVGTCNCGDVHGGKHLAKNFRRAILTGKTVKCFEMLYKGAGILSELIRQSEKGLSQFDRVFEGRIADSYQGFQSKNFHCCWTTLQRIQELSSLDISPLNNSVSGFIGGIGFSGTLCGAVVGGVLALGLKYGIDPRDRGYKDTMKIVYQGLLKSDGIFRDEKIFPAAANFNRCKILYRILEEKYGDCNCTTISGLDMNRIFSIQEFKAKNKIEDCRRLSETIAQKASLLLNA
jgi:C_GCAxxG_C_C family probable redox protein